MPTGKRASMREGPLAALFRKTAEDVEPTRRDAEPPASPPPPAEEASAAPAEPPAPAEFLEPEIEEPRIPLPHERLRHAFSADIPENMLERPSGPPPAEPEPDVYARPGRAAEAPAPAPKLGPVLRVVGVGGAGVNAINRMVEAEIEGI
ncbi:MAG: cell division protein FtsZ, partial [Solirubrobacterales bacterium]|nr:cell division protein FtsZ [Solirubrobacterales bacterium]